MARVPRMRDKDIRRVAGYIDRIAHKPVRDAYPTAKESWSIARYVIWSFPILVRAGFIGHRVKGEVPGAEALRHKTPG